MKRINILISGQGVHNVLLGTTIISNSIWQNQTIGYYSNFIDVILQIKNKYPNSCYTINAGQGYVEVRYNIKPNLLHYTNTPRHLYSTHFPGYTGLIYNCDVALIYY